MSLWRLFNFTNDFLAVGSNPVLSQLCHVYRSAVILVSVGVLMGREDCISFQTRPKSVLNFMLKHCSQNSFNQD